MDGIFQLFQPDLRSFAFHAVKQNPLAGSVVSLPPDHQHRRDLGGASKYVYLGFGAPTPSPRTSPQNPALHGAVRSHCSAFVAAAPEGMEDGSMARSGQCVHRNSTPIPAVQPTRLLLHFHAVAGRSHTLPKLRSWAGSSCPAGGAGLLGCLAASAGSHQRPRQHSNGGGIPSIHLDRMMNMQQADGQSQQHTPDNLYRASASALPCTSQDGALGLARRLVVPGTLIAFAIRMG